MHFFVLNLNLFLYIFHNLSLYCQSSDHLETFRETGKPGDKGRFFVALQVCDGDTFLSLCSTKNRQPLSKWLPVILWHAIKIICL